ncbi:MAG: hypothetical protein HY895_11960 [Deltaproteobacteria bacterium]|nr:hypothetical protein [Deltaproteobacteria bacterium]
MFKRHDLQLTGTLDGAADELVRNKIGEITGNDKDYKDRWNQADHQAGFDAAVQNCCAQALKARIRQFTLEPTHGITPHFAQDSDSAFSARPGFYTFLSRNQLKSIRKIIGMHFARPDGTALAKTRLDLERLRPFVAKPSRFRI